VRARPCATPPARPGKSGQRPCGGDHSRSIVPRNRPSLAPAEHSDQERPVDLLTTGTGVPGLWARRPAKSDRQAALAKQSPARSARPNQIHGPQRFAERTNNARTGRIAPLHPAPVCLAKSLTTRVRWPFGRIYDTADRSVRMPRPGRRW